MTCEIEEEIGDNDGFEESGNFDPKLVKDYLLGMANGLPRHEKARLAMIVYKVGLMTIEEVKTLGLEVKFLKTKK